MVDLERAFPFQSFILELALINGRYLISYGRVLRSLRVLFHCQMTCSLSSWYSEVKTGYPHMQLRARK